MTKCMNAERGFIIKLDASTCWSVFDESFGYKLVDLPRILCDQFLHKLRLVLLMVQLHVCGVCMYVHMDWSDHR